MGAPGGQAPCRAGQPVRVGAAPLAGDRRVRQGVAGEAECLHQNLSPCLANVVYDQRLGIVPGRERELHRALRRNLRRQLCLGGAGDQQGLCDRVRRAAQADGVLSPCGGAADTRLPRDDQRQRAGPERPGERFGKRR